MCKVKSIEYQALRLLVDHLQEATEAGNFERAQDSRFTQFVKEYKAFSRNIDSTLSDHPETFYIDLFSTAFSMLAKKSAKDREMLEDLLFSDTVKFMALLLKANEEKNSGKRYVGQIDFESQIFVDSAPVPKEANVANRKKAAGKPSNVHAEAKP